MEMEPGGPSSKKVKSAAVNSRQEAQAPATPASPATEAPCLDPAETPPAADEDDGRVDRISNLPTPILRCLLPDSTVQGLHLPQLKQLALERVSISEGTLCGLIARCPALECLLIYYSFGFQCARINSLSLISIGVRLRHRYLSDHETDEPQFRELIIENAPSLERLLRVDILDGLHVSIISAPKLETLGSLHGEMYLSSSILQSISGDLNLWKRKHRDLIKCLDLRLKTVVMQFYRGIRAQVNFATFFILNARMLELMSFKVDTEYYCRAFLAEQRKELQLEKRASRGARFHFQTDRLLRCYSMINNVRDLDLSDPFVCKR
uniref:Uncharacterized protein n=1 Tax=Aegilops tauschii TaxID=37682 RepID=M8CFF8_AEGTA